ncbi:DUF924 family protein [Pararhodospirillum photometricum]|uniref:Uncharacterized protein n=1 Tax=Pararhodospirillum photometricum DSM 122 TaxID=1150469 RepID=H6SPZ2_PARPM|nr:DUF924 family protein [Pararhodospirillum photometricum]CCG07262.1 Putative uncharacterized protein [Pararhodospirillum photometricum DSM 122]
MTVARDLLDLDPALPLSDRVRRVWFAPDGSPRPWWFTPADTVDAVLIALFSKDTGLALTGAHDALRATPEGALALLILLDALPRRLWAGHDKASAGNAAARALVIDSLRQGHDRHWPPAGRLLAGLCFLRSPDPIDQERGFALVDALGRPDWLAWALQKGKAGEARLPSLNFPGTPPGKAPPLSPLSASKYPAPPPAPESPPRPRKY